MKKNKREIAERVKTLRVSSGMNQEKFATSLPVARSRVSEWEAAKRVPSPEHFYKLGSLASNPDDAIWFWKQAGLDDEKLLTAGRKVAGDRAKEGEPLFERREVVLVKRYRYTAQGREEAGPPYPIALESAPNPNATICLSVQERSTFFKSSTDGLLVLDTSLEGTEDLTRLWDKEVAIYQPPNTGTPSGFKGTVLVGYLQLSDKVLRPLNPNEITFAGVVVPQYRLEGEPIGTMVGICTDPEGLRGANSEEDVVRRRAEFRRLALSRFRLDKAQELKVLGRVIGRLTGHLK